MKTFQHKIVAQSVMSGDVIEIKRSRFTVVAVTREGFTYQLIVRSRSGVEMEMTLQRDEEVALIPGRSSY